MELNNELINQVKITPLLDTLRLENIDDEIYFSKQYSNYISNSRLGLLKSQGAEAFFKGIKSEYNSSFETGSLIHTMCLQKNDYEVINDVFKPTAKAGLMADYLYNELIFGKNSFTFPTDDDIKSASYKIGYYKDKLTSNRLSEFRNKAETYWRDRYIYETNNPYKEGDKKRIYTDERNFELLNNCINSLEKDTNIQKLLNPESLIEEPIIRNEHTILLDVVMSIPGYQDTIYKLKAKLDNFTICDNTITVNDLKTTSRPVSAFDPTYYSYQREIAFYSWLLKLISKKHFNIESPEIKGNFLVVSTVPDYGTCVYPMTTKLFKSGWKEVLYLLKCVCYLNLVKGYEFNTN